MKIQLTITPTYVSKYGRNLELHDAEDNRVILSITHVSPEILREIINACENQIAQMVVDAQKARAATGETGEDE